MQIGLIFPDRPTDNTGARYRFPNAKFADSISFFEFEQGNSQFDVLVGMDFLSRLTSLTVDISKGKFTLCH